MYQLDATNFIMIYAAVIQHISTPEDGHVNVRNM